MATFEYMQVEVVRNTHGELSVIATEKDGIDRFATSFANLVPFLNDLGQDGWEVVSVLPGSSTVRGTFSSTPRNVLTGFEANSRLEERIYVLKRVLP